MIEKDETWQNDRESSDKEMKSLAYTAISLLGGLVMLGVGMLVMLL